MPRLLASLALVVHALLCCGPTLAQTGPELDPRTMTRTEVYMLQDALLWASTYGSLKDGGWGA